MTDSYWYGKSSAGYWGDIEDTRCKVQVQRKWPEEYAAYLGTVELPDIELASPEMLQKRFGGGTYYMSIRDAHGRYKGHRHEKIAGPPAPGTYKEKSVWDALRAVEASSQLRDIDDLAERIEALEESFEWLQSYVMRERD